MNFTLLNVIIPSLPTYPQKAYIVADKIANIVPVLIFFMTIISLIFCIRCIKNHVGKMNFLKWLLAFIPCIYSNCILPMITNLASGLELGYNPYVLRAWPIYLICYFISISIQIVLILHFRKKLLKSQNTKQTIE